MNLKPKYFIMSRFIKVPTTGGRNIIVNTDKILFVTSTESGVFLTFKIKESGQHDGWNIALPLDEFLSLVEDKG